MGGHGGLNILPQKKWNVYNYDNRDIVEKDKKIHAQKMRNKYQNDRKNTLLNKFDILKAQLSTNSVNQDQYKKQLKKDSILNHEFKRLAEENQHVNLFEHQQKILENREVLEYKKLKEAQFLKQKDLDYSSKFLGTYNKDSKIPWYTMTKMQKKYSNMTKQRYDMDDLVDQIREKKDRNQNRYYRESYRKEKYLRANEPPNYEIKDEKLDNIKRQNWFDSERERSRDRKYEFLKSREKQIAKTNEFDHLDKEFNNVEEKPQVIQDDKTVKDCSEIKKTQEQKDKLNEQQKSPKNKLTKSEKQDMERLREKRFKREEKERKRINQLKIKFLQNSN